MMEENGYSGRDMARAFRAGLACARESERAASGDRTAQEGFDRMMGAPIDAMDRMREEARCDG